MRFEVSQDSFCQQRQRFVAIQAFFPTVVSHLVSDVAERIRNHAEKNGIDMIVMGSHGNGALRNLVMGSVATKVLATTTAPVLLIR